MGDILKKLALLCTVAASMGLFFQNCSNDVEFNETANSENPFGIGETRRLNIDPNNSENRPPLHVTTIYDNSYSTESIQTKMVNGFSSAIDQVRGFNVSASLHTTSHDQNADKPSSEATDLISYEDSNGNPVEIPASEIGNLPANTNYVEKTVYRLSASWFLNRKPLVYQASNGNFEDFKDYYTRSVAALGTDGADTEQGLCTLLKKIEQNRQFGDPDNLAYHLYILATNENDFTTLQNCPIETRVSHSFEQSSTTTSCSAGDPQCQFNYRINQNPILTNSAEIRYSFDRSNVRIYGEGTRFEERWSFNKANAAHKISYQERELTTNYQVLAWCDRDGIQVPCEGADNPSISPQKSPGICSISGQQNCNSSQAARAASLAGISVSEVRSCKISCSERWINRDLPDNKVPNRSKVCGASSNSVGAAEQNAVENHEGHNFVRNIARSCTDRTSSDSLARNNGVNSCPSANFSRTCNGTDKSYISSRKNVPVNEIVGTCNYTCRERTRTNNHALPAHLQASSSFSCSALDNTSYPNGCSAEQIDFLKSRGNSFNENVNFQCRIGCTVQEATDSISISTNGLSCPSSGTNCNSSQLNQASADLGAQTNNIKSCQVNCNQNSTNQPRCDLNNIMDANLCSNSAELLSRCGQLNRGDLNVGSCSRRGGTKTTTTVNKTTGATEVVEIKDLDGVTESTDIPNMIAQRMQRVHGSGFFASFFIHPSNDPSCAPPQNLSEGEQYEALSGILGKYNSSTYPICLEDYSQALDSVIKIAVDNVLSKFNLDIADEEVVYEVKATYFDGSTEIIPESEYDVFKKTISFKDKLALKDVKTLDFGVWRP